jgi:hypothetical protein
LNQSLGAEVTNKISELQFVYRSIFAVVLEGTWKELGRRLEEG